MPLFETCTQCGKKRLSVGINKGLCSKCLEENRVAEMRQAEERRKAGISAAEDFYRELADLWEKTGARWYYTIRSLECAKQTVSNCDRFAELLREIPEYEYFQPVFASHCSSIGSESCSNSDFGELKTEKVDKNTVKIDFEQLLQNIERCRERAVHMVQNSHDFADMLSKLPHVDIYIDGQAVPAEKKSPGSFESKNITSRTRVDRLSVFYAVDVETTGLNPMEDEIISLSAVKFVNFEPVEAFTTFIKPRNGLNARAQAVNRITETDVNDAPYIESVADAFRHFITPDYAAKNYPPIVGHNLSFDYNFLIANGINTLCFTRPHYDTLELARREYKWLDSFKLDTLTSDVLHISRSSSHSSLSDALVTGLLFKQICKSRIGI